MKPYPDYKDSGIEWLGKIPAHWEVLKTRRLSRVKRGASPRPIDDPKYFDENGEFSWVRIADITASKRYLKKTTQKLSELGSSLSVKQYPGDLFLSIAGTVGKPIISKIKCCIHDGFVWFPDLKTNKEYLYYIFSSGEPYSGLGKWGTQLNLNTETIGDIYLPFPSDSEIDTIAAYLDHKTRQIDLLIKKKERLIELLKEQRTAIINHAVTRGLNPDVKLKDSGIEWLGKIPEHWMVRKLKHAVYINHRVLSENTDSNFEFEYIDISNVNSSGKINQTQTMQFKHAPSRARRVVKNGDTIVSTVRTYLKAISHVETDNEKLVASTGFSVLTPTSRLNSKFLYYLISCQKVVDTISSLSVGVNYPAINTSDLASIAIWFPESSFEQNDIVKYVEDKTKKIEMACKKQEQSIDLLKEYRTAVISAAVTGKIDVREFKP